MKEENRKGLVASIFEALFVSVPLWIGKKTDQAINRHVTAKQLLEVGVGALSLSGFLAAKYLSEFLKHFRVMVWYESVSLGFIFYALYLVMTLPFFLILTRTSGTNQDEERGRKRKHLAEKDIQAAKEKAGEKEAYLGSSLWTGKPFYVTDEMRLMHTHVVGSTGVGKTESVLIPLLKRDIERGNGAIVIDAKGDLELLAKIRYFVEINQRKNDFLFFSLSHPEISDTYNPLSRGNASEIKDKLIGSTEWGEEFFRKKAEEAALTLLRPLIHLERKVTFRDLYELLTVKAKLQRLIHETSDERMARDLETMKEMYHENMKYLSGFIADLGIVTKSEFSRLTDSGHSKIDLLDVYQQKKIVFFALNTQGYEETAKRFGRLILQDIKTVSNYIQTQTEESERHFFPIYVDEFSSFAYENFIELLNKARGAKLAVTLLHQSLADLAQKRPTFQQQIIENTNVKIIMRQDDPDSIDKYSKIGGSKRTLISTYQTEDSMLGTGFTGRGSLREGQAFRVDPDLIRSLGRGEAVVITKFPRFRIDYLKLAPETNINLEWIHTKIKGERKSARAQEVQAKLIEQESSEFKTLHDTVRKYAQEEEITKASA